jgi:hypothetical protein
MVVQFPEHQIPGVAALPRAGADVFEALDELPALLGLKWL